MYTIGGNPLMNAGGMGRRACTRWRHTCVAYAYMLYDMCKRRSRIVSLFPRDACDLCAGLYRRVMCTCARTCVFGEETRAKRITRVVGPTTNYTIHRSVARVCVCTHICTIYDTVLTRVYVRLKEEPMLVGCANCVVARARALVYLYDTYVYVHVFIVWCCCAAYSLL